MPAYKGNNDYRGWLNADPNKQWALAYVGNDGGVNTSKLANDVAKSYGGSINGDDARSSLASKVQTLKGFANEFTQPQSTGVAAGGGGDGGASAQNARLAGQLRGDVTGIASQIKDLYNQRYGQVDANASEQTGKLNDRYGNEAQDLTGQIESENQKVGAGFAGRGTADSSYNSNSQDTVTNAGKAQIRDLGQELQDNLGKIASWVSQQKTGFDAQKGGIDSVLSHLAQETDSNNLMSIRNTLEGRLTDLKAGGAENNTQAQNMSTLETISPSSTRANQLKTTLSQIISGNAKSDQKATIAGTLIGNSGLNADDQKKLQDAFNSDLEKIKRTT